MKKNFAQTIVDAPWTNITREEYIGRADACYIKSDFQNAEVLATQGLEYYPHTLGLLVLRGQARIELKRYKDAGEDLRDALTIAPDDFDALHNLAICLQEHAEDAQMLVEAEQLFQQAIKVHPLSESCRNNYGVMLMELKNYEQAAEQFLSILQINPENNIGRVHYALARFMTGENSAEVRDHFKEVWENDSRIYEAGYYLVLSLLRNKEYQQARMYAEFVLPAAQEAGHKTFEKDLRAHFPGLGKKHAKHAEHFSLNLQ